MMSHPSVQSDAPPDAPEQVRLFDFPVDLLSTAQGVARVEAVLASDATLHVVTLNPEMIMQGESDPELGRILKSAGLVIPDGAGVVWALRNYGYKTSRLPGIEFSEALLARAEQQQYRVAIVGAKPEVLARAIESLKRRYPSLNLVYSHHGFFETPEAEAQLVQACAESRPQLLFVALGVPRQEKWIDTYRNLFSGAALVGIGGSLDVWSGTSRRAPGWMRALNLEWLYRITSEPWRIKRIYKTLPMFVVKVLTTPAAQR